MQAWDYLEKRWVDSDATRWVCCWTTDPTGVLDDDDRDLADLVYEYRDFGSRGKGLAIAHAKRIIESGEEAFGCVHVYRESFEMVDATAGSFEREPETLIEITHQDLEPPRA